MNKTTITISETDYSAMTLGMGSPGVCLACGDLDEYAGCEPDARDYECPACGEHKLHGLEEALIIGALTITVAP
jgi:hypothetical protein